MSSINHYIEGMILVDNILVSDEIMDNFFVCNLQKCKGACCVEGDLGAPLEKEELPIIQENYEKVEPYLCKEGIDAIQRQGKYIKDFEGDYSTPTIGNKECAYAIYDENNHLKCGIEQAYIDGKTTFRKPISCHLYPIRISKFKEFDVLNYDQWDICSPACDHGQELGIQLYKFLKEPLVRKYGRPWYELLTNIIERPDKAPPKKRKK